MKKTTNLNTMAKWALVAAWGILGGCTNIEPRGGGGYRTSRPAPTPPSANPQRPNPVPAPAPAPVVVQNADVRLLQEENRRLSGQVGDLERQLDELRNQISRLQQGLNGQITRSDLRPLEMRIEGLEKDLNQQSARNEAALKQTREAMISEVNSILAEKLREVSARSAASSGGSQRTANTSTAPSRTVPANVPNTGYNHVVKSGETISVIAQAYNSKTDWILHANNISDPTKIQVDQKLFIPVAE